MLLSMDSSSTVGKRVDVGLERCCIFAPNILEHTSACVLATSYHRRAIPFEVASPANHYRLAALLGARRRRREGPRAVFSGDLPSDLPDFLPADLQLQDIRARQPLHWPDLSG